MTGLSRKSSKSVKRRFWLTTTLIACAWVYIALPSTKLRPANVENICEIFDDRYSWYKAANASEQRWGTPKPVQMAIMRQESSFIFNARPPRTKLLGFIPWKRPSNAYGFAQALDNTWRWYLDDTGRESANRDDFEDAIDFVGWYTNKSNKAAGISKWDPYNQYLAYHEGQSGGNNPPSEQNAWLTKTAKHVDSRAREWWGHLQGCEEDLDSRWWLVRRLLS